MNIAYRKLGWVSLLLAVAFFSGCQTSSGPTAAGGNVTGTLYFNASNSTINGNDIVALDLSSGTVTRLIAGNDPFVTSDHKIIFNDVDLKECDLTGMNPRIIAQRTATSEYGRPQASMNNQLVAYNESHAVYVVKRSDGSLASSLTANPGSYYNPTWTNGGSVVVQGGYMNYGFWITNTAGLTKIPGNLDNAQVPRADPTGTKLAFSMDGNIYTMDIAGSNVQKIVSDGTNYSAPFWSPDGKYLAFTAGVRIFYADIATGTVHSIENEYTNIHNGFRYTINTNNQMSWN